MAGEQFPAHLEGLPTLDDAEFLLGGLSNEELARIPVAVNDLHAQFQNDDPAGTRYLVLGSYDTPNAEREGPKDRLEAARARLETGKPQATAVLLEDIDPRNDNWENFYVKFRLTMATTDFNVLIAEHNDGGHELELGAATLEETYIAKRDYRHASLDKDLEYEKYDAMMATLFDLMDRRGHLFAWRTREEFEDAIHSISTETHGKTTRS
ncbi:hypothetical protein [Natronomonas sp. EA1]|uniref:hypothetical protein n=1 Tax=Natronomonas sp. EA1 TaxID=3421655 RepID=UPI003EBD2719